MEQLFGKHEKDGIFPRNRISTKESLFNGS